MLNKKNFTSIFYKSYHCLAGSILIYLNEVDFGRPIEHNFYIGFYIRSYTSKCKIYNNCLEL